jgi:hypothetical protein
VCRQLPLSILKPLLDIALDHLTLGRAAHNPTRSDSERRARSDAPYLETARRELDAAVDGLRRAGQQVMLPNGLLTRAWCSFAQAMEHRLHGQQTQAEECEKRAQEDLDEAWEIAERGPMKLFMADIHLYRARLFGHETLYPWESRHADLAEARQLIEKGGYGRRKEELEDAEAGLRQQH